MSRPFLVDANCRKSAYSSWRMMKNRCNNPNDPKYKNHGGRGICYCEKWSSFSAFLVDMGERPTSSTLDRIDNNKGYYKENCRWSSYREQNNNKSNNVILTLNNESHTVSEWALLLNINVQTLFWRIRKGWNIERILSRVAA